MKYEWITINDERVAVKKGIEGYRIVKPIKNEDGTLNLKNLLIGGSWIQLLIIVGIILLVLGLANEYTSNLKITSACLRALPDYIDLSLYIKNPTLNNTGFLFP
jgi:hypothetical protein